MICSELSDVGAMGKLPRLTSLRLMWCNALTDISPLSCCTALRSLSIFAGAISEKSINALKAAKPELSLSLTRSHPSF